MSDADNQTDLGATLVGGVAPGTDPWIVSDILAQLAEQGQSADLLFVVRDDRRLEDMRSLLSFVCTQADIHVFPAWDCLPYDRVSPRPDIQAKRVAQLSRWLAGRGASDSQRIFLTTINALVQKVPGADYFSSTQVRLYVDAEVDFEELVRNLSDLGYRRVGTVREPGEFAPRGGLVDIFPIGQDQPVRVDLFGDTVESLKHFDPMDQRTRRDSQPLSLGTTREFRLTDDSITRFRSGFRKHLSDPDKDPYYQAVSEGRVIDGLDHWLPLFFDQLQDLVDVVAPSAVVFEEQSPEALEARFETIADFYAARTEASNLPKGSELPYRALPTQMLYLDAAGLNTALEATNVWQLSSFVLPSQPDLPVLNNGIRPHPDFAEERNDPDKSLPMAVAARAKEAWDEEAKLQVLLSASSFGALQRLNRLWAEMHGGVEPNEIRRLDELTSKPSQSVAGAITPLSRSFQLGTRLLVITAEDVFGQRAIRSRRKKRADDFLREVSSLKSGDLVVHIDHGIGQYDGLVSIDINAAAHDVLQILYYGGDKLFVPVENIDVLSRFGDASEGIVLDRLGGASWQERKSKAKDRITVIAIELMRMAAARKLRTAEKLVVSEAVLEDFASIFPFTETDDQLAAIDDVVEDLGAGRPMDRLVCGDVGFGKTEVAIRAAFVAVASGKQAAVVVPTTLLARQHFASFESRMRQVGIEVRQFSRLVPAGQLAKNKQDLIEGKVDLAIGTHALLAKGDELPPPPQAGDQMSLL